MDKLYEEGTNPRLLDIKSLYNSEQARALYSDKIREMWRLKGYLEQLRMLIMTKEKEEESGFTQNQVPTSPI